MVKKMIAIGYTTEKSPYYSLSGDRTYFCISSKSSGMSILMFITPSPMLILRFYRN